MDRKKPILLLLAALMLCAGCRGQIGQAGLTEQDAPKVTAQRAERTEESGRVCLDVTNILQNPGLPNGCEVVSLAIALGYAGCPVDPLELYGEYMPKSPYGSGDPWTSYVGDATGKGLGCYAPCVAETGNSYLERVGADLWVADVSGRELSAYEALIDRGTPVILWGMIGMIPRDDVCWQGSGEDGAVWHRYSHCLVLIGYTEDSYIFCDPLEGVVEYGKADVAESFAINFRQACAVI